VKPLTKRFSEIIGIVNVGRGDEDRDVWHEVAALEARIEELEEGIRELAYMGPANDYRGEALEDFVIVRLDAIDRLKALAAKEKP